MLAGGFFDSGTAGYYPLQFGPGGFDVFFVIIVFDKAKSSFFGNRRNGASPENLALTKEDLGVAMGFSLVLTRKIKVDIGFFIAFKA